MITPLPFVSINGEIFSKEKAFIPALNSGVLFGEGVFTTMKVRDSIPLFFDKHQRRLLTHMEQLGFSQYSFDFSLKDAVQKLIVKNKKKDCAVRITIINGAKQPLVIIHARDLPSTFNTGVGLITMQDTRDAFKTTKTINRLFLTQAHAQAEKKGAADALLVYKGMIIESTICNIFSLNEKGMLVTPKLDGKGLKGIPREVIMEQIQVLEKDISEKTRGPFVLVNSLRIQKVASVDGKIADNGEDLFRKIKSILEKAENKYLRNAKDVS